ncbi:MAG: response regulator transcription factor, partial [Pseudomonadota bacterium]
MKLLLVEDDRRIVEFLARGLRAEGHHVEAAEDGETGLERARGEAWDAIILDVMLPKMDGRELCRTLRLERRETPILMLTAMDATSDVVKGLRLGADDYLTKPFAFDELLARIETLPARASAAAASPEENVLRVADLAFDRDALIVRRAEREVTLTSLEYALLEFLMLEQGKVVSRARILQNVWGAHED